MACTRNCIASTAAQVLLRLLTPALLPAPVPPYLPMEHNVVTLTPHRPRSPVLQAHACDVMNESIALVASAMPLRQCRGSPIRPARAAPKLPSTTQARVTVHNLLAEQQSGCSKQYQNPNVAHPRLAILRQLRARAWCTPHAADAKMHICTEPHAPYMSPSWQRTRCGACAMPR